MLTPLPTTPFAFPAPPTSNSYLLALIAAASSGEPITEFPPVVDQVLIRERMRAKVAREAEGGAKANGGGGDGASTASGGKGTPANDDEDIFTEVDDASEAVGVLDVGAAGGQETGADAEDIGGSLEDLD